MSTRLACALALALAAAPALAQHDGHAPAPPPERDPHAGHAAHPAPPATPATPPAGEPHAHHGHGGHGGHDADTAAPATALPREPIPTPTDADREAARYEGVHATHGDVVVTYLLVDRLERRNARDGSHDLAWDVTGWSGTDRHRLWLRSEGSRGHGSEGGVEALYGRPVAPWWDALVGVRRDVGDGARTWLAAGVTGLAPQKFEVDATVYLGEGGLVGLRGAAEYDLLLTNRLILQPSLEAEAWNRTDAAAGLGRGLSRMEAGLRLRYEVTRRFAPYVGVSHERLSGAAADLHAARGEPVRETRWVAGVRVWF